MKLSSNYLLFATLAKFKRDIKLAFYKEYVEPLEIEHDSLLEENKELRHKIRCLTESVLNKENTRLREQNLKLIKERDMYKRMYLDAKDRK